MKWSHNQASHATKMTYTTTTKKYQFPTRRKLFTKFQCYINIMLFVICHHKTSQPTQSYQLCTITFFAKYNLFISHNMVVSKLYAVHVTISRSRNQCTRHVCVYVCVLLSRMLTIELYTIYRRLCDLFQRNCPVIQFNKTLKLLK